MPRVGMNPQRDKSFDGKLPPNIPAVAIVVHLPDDGSAYHKGRPEIVEACLTSARKFAGREHHLVVFDNGSGKVGKRIIAKAAPDLLITSDNIGKLNAWGLLLRMFSGSIISVSDDDILYYPDWLANQVRVLEAYDNRPDRWTVASVTGVVTKQNAQTQCAATWRWAEKEAQGFEKLDTCPNEWDAQHGMSCGRDAKTAAGYQKANFIATVQYNNVKARVCGGHTQFTCRADTIREVIPYPVNKMMMQTYNLFDNSVDAHGWLKLATWERTARHLGNVLGDDDRKEIEELLK